MARKGFGISVVWQPMRDGEHQVVLLIGADYCSRETMPFLGQRLLSVPNSGGAPYGGWYRPSLRRRRGCLDANRVPASDGFEDSERVIDIVLWWLQGGTLGAKRSRRPLKHLYPICRSGLPHAQWAGQSS